MGYLDPPPAGQVPVEVELLLQLQGLVPGVGLPPTLSIWICAREEERRVEESGNLNVLLFFLNTPKTINCGAAEAGADNNDLKKKKKGICKRKQQGAINEFVIGI